MHIPGHQFLEPFGYLVKTKRKYTRLYLVTLASPSCNCTRRTFLAMHASSDNYHDWNTQNAISQTGHNYPNASCAWTSATSFPISCEVAGCSSSHSLEFCGPPLSLSLFYRLGSTLNKLRVSPAQCQSPEIKKKIVSG